MAGLPGHRGRAQRPAERLEPQPDLDFAAAHPRPRPGPLRRDRHAHRHRPGGDREDPALRPARTSSSAASTTARTWGRTSSTRAPWPPRMEGTMFGFPSYAFSLAAWHPHRLQRRGEPSSRCLPRRSWRSPCARASLLNINIPDGPPEASGASARDPPGQPRLPGRDHRPGRPARPALPLDRRPGARPGTARHGHRLLLRAAGLRRRSPR